MEGACVETETMAVPAEFGLDPSSSALYNSVDRVRYLDGNYLTIKMDIITVHTLCCMVYQ